MLSYKLSILKTFFSIVFLALYISCVKEIHGPFSKENYIEMNNTLAEVEKLLKLKFNQENFLSEENMINIKDHEDGILCKSCLYVFKTIHNFLDKKYGFSFLFQLIGLLCEYVIQFEKSVCKHAIEMWAPTITDALIEHYLDAEYICTNRLICQFDHYKELNADEYATRLLKDKPEKIKPNITSEKILKILHMSDVHTDLKYQEGSNANCGKPLCCREENGLPTDPSFAAGRWGYKGFCDLPRITVYNFLEYVKDVIKPDMILWTGDAPSHSVWDSSDHEATDVIHFFTSLMKNKFNYTIPIYPAIGNHEFYPTDLFDPFNQVKNEKTLNITAYLWKDWIGEEGYNSYVRRGYYTTKHPNSNLRIISLNTMDCDVLNFNIIKNPTDPNSQFKWLESVLRQSEKDGEIVYLIGHIPPGDSTYTSECSKRYNALSDRFSNIIRGHFYGHTHYDEFRTIHEYFNYTIIAGLIHIAPSLTTYTEKNPQFRVYKVDDKTKIVLDYDQYLLNITKANNNPKANPDWEIMYNAKDAFKINNMTDYGRFINITQNLIKNSSIDNLNKQMSIFFGAGIDYDRNLNNKKFGKYLGCRFEKDNFNDYMKCIKYRSWDSAEYSNFALSFFSGKWYEKYHDIPHD